MVCFLSLRKFAIYTICILYTEISSLNNIEQYGKEFSEISPDQLLKAYKNHTRCLNHLQMSIMENKPSRGKQVMELQAAYDGLIFCFCFFHNI